MFLLIPSLILVAYAIISGILPLKISWGLKLVLSLLIAVIGFKYQIYTLGDGTWLKPSVNRSTMLVLEALYGALICFVLLLFFKDLINLIFWLIGKSRHAAFPSLNKNSIIASLGVLGVLLGIWGTYEAVRVPDVKKQLIEIKNLNQAWKGFKIAQLSDLHLGPVQGHEWLQKVVDKVNALKPDLVVITGDFVDGATHDLLKEQEPLTRIQSKYGVIGIPGNHEYYSGYYAWMQALKDMGITMLENESAVLTRGDESLVIGGTTDFGAYRFGMTNPDLKKTFANTPESPRILLTHQPKTTYRSTEPFDLQLSGHTHGGHMIFLHPLVGYFNDWLVSGLYKRGNRTIYVNNGTGLWNGFSQRLFVPSEITEIILQ